MFKCLKIFFPYKKYNMSRCINLLVSWRRVSVFLVKKLVILWFPVQKSVIICGKCLQVLLLKNKVWFFINYIFIFILTHCWSDNLFKFVKKSFPNLNFVMLTTQFVYRSGRIAWFLRRIPALCPKRDIHM